MCIYVVLGACHLSSALRVHKHIMQTRLAPLLREWLCTRPFLLLLVLTGGERLSQELPFYNSIHARVYVCVHPIHDFPSEQAVLETTQKDSACTDLQALEQNLAELSIDQSGRQVCTLSFYSIMCCCR